QRHTSSLPYALPLSKGSTPIGLVVSRAADCARVVTREHLLACREGVARHLERPAAEGLAAAREVQLRRLEEARELAAAAALSPRSEEHTSELQSRVE